MSIATLAFSTSFSFFVIFLKISLNSFVFPKQPHAWNDDTNLVLMMAFLHDASDEE